MSIIIRPVEAQDNAALAEIIRSSLAEFGFQGPGCAANDPEVDAMYEHYQAPASGYWVLWDDEKDAVVGGGGFSGLRGTTPEEAVCELQKLYFRPYLRGKGWGKRFLAHILDEAQKAGYEGMYLESGPMMIAAIALYEKMGFLHIAKPMGNTGHTQCQVHMHLKLTDSPQFVSAFETALR